jgi:Flp pilus assembly protein TadG
MIRGLRLKPVHRCEMKQASSNLQKYFYQGDDRGSAYVEFCLILPVLLLFFLGTLEFGLAFREHQVLQNAAREGAHFSSLPANDAPVNDPNRAAKISAIKQYVIDYCSAENITVGAGDITIDQNYAIAVGVDLFVHASQVSVVHIHAPITGGAFLPGGGVMTLQANAVFRNMY